MQLIHLTRNLPPGCALHRAVDPEWWYWTPQHELLALVAEEVDALRALMEAVHEKDGSGRVRKPLHVPRPYDVKFEGSSLAQMQAFAAQYGGEVEVQ